jgi:hypothetical protein
MKKPVFLLVMFLVPLNSIALEKVTDVNLKQKFSENIRISGNICNSCTDVYVIGKDYRGSVYRIICNNNLLAYTLTVTPTGKYIVKPW